MLSLGQELKLDDLDFSGSSIVGSNSKGDEAGSKTNTHLTEPMQKSLRGTTPEHSDSWSDDAERDLSSPARSPGSTPSQGTSIEEKKARFRRTKKKKKGDDVPNTSSDSLERVINVKSCPLCQWSSSATQLKI